MDEGEAGVLKETLCKQYLVMKRLYTELEEERRAAATAADEALSMILRLQVEKAEEKMEACQYKKLAEEKMRHAEESMFILEEIIHQKELEITSLKHQVQFLKHRLFVTGENNNDIGDLRMYKTSLLETNSPFFNMASFNRDFRRNISLPALRYEKLYNKDFIRTDSFLLHTGGLTCREIDDSANQLGGDFEGAQRYCLNKSLIERCNWGDADLSDKMKELLQYRRAEEIARFASTSGEEAFLMAPRINPLSSDEHYHICNSASSSKPYEGTEMNLIRRPVSILDSQSEDPENIAEADILGTACMNAELNKNMQCLVTNQEICEVPGSHRDHALAEPYEQKPRKPALVTKGKAKMPDEAIDYYFGDGDPLRNALVSIHSENILSKPRKSNSSNYHFNLPEHRIEIARCQTDVQQLKQRLQHLEKNGRITKQEDSERGWKQLNLLMEICEQLDILQCHIKNFIYWKQPPEDDPIFVSLVEVGAVRYLRQTQILKFITNVQRHHDVFKKLH